MQGNYTLAMAFPTDKWSWPVLSWFPSNSTCNKNAWFCCSFL